MPRFRVRWWLPSSAAREVYVAVDHAACALGLVVDGAEIDDTATRFEVVCTDAGFDEGGEELEHLPEELAAVRRCPSC